MIRAISLTEKLPKEVHKSYYASQCPWSPATVWSWLLGGRVAFGPTVWYIDVSLIGALVPSEFFLSGWLGISGAVFEFAIRLS